MAATCPAHFPARLILTAWGNWCTGTVTDGDAGRYRAEGKAESSYDAAHLDLMHVCAHVGCGFPIPTTSRTVEVLA